MKFRFHRVFGACTALLAAFCSASDHPTIAEAEYFLAQAVPTTQPQATDDLDTLEKLIQEFGSIIRDTPEYIIYEAEARAFGERLKAQMANLDEKGLEKLRAELQQFNLGRAANIPVAERLATKLCERLRMHLRSEETRISSSAALILARETDYDAEFELRIRCGNGPDPNLVLVRKKLEPIFRQELQRQRALFRPLLLPNDSSAEYKVALALTELRDPVSLQVRLGFLNGENPELGLHVLALDPNPAYLPFLIELLKRPDEDIDERFLHLTLARYREAWIEPVRQEWNQFSDDAKLAVLYSVSAVPSRKVQAFVIQTLSDSNPEIRLAALDALAYLSDEEWDELVSGAPPVLAVRSAALPALRKMLADNDRGVRNLAREILDRLEPKRSPSYPLGRPQPRSGV